MIKPISKSPKTPFPNPRSLKIETIRRQFRGKREWLLIAIDEFDEKITKAIRGHVIAHSRNVDEIHDASIRYKGFAMIDFSDRTLPRNTAIIY